MALLSYLIEFLVRLAPHNIKVHAWMMEELAIQNFA